MIAMLRPVAPFVEYVINYDYISKVLCINKDKPKLPDENEEILLYVKDNKSV